MTLYYTLVFMVLVVEMVIFGLLTIPLPFTVRRKIFTFISENPLVAKVQYGLKITFIFILILFVDSVNRVYRVQQELAAASHPDQNSGRAAIIGHERLEVQARKFYSERNMYLCGSTLALSLILNRTYTMILDILRLEEKVKLHEEAAAKPGKAVDPKEFEKLKAELARKDQDLETIKKQAAGLHREYDALSDKYAETQKKDGTPKKDL